MATSADCELSRAYARNMPMVKITEEVSGKKGTTRRGRMAMATTTGKSRVAGTTLVPAVKQLRWEMGDGRWEMGDGGVWKMPLGYPKARPHWETCT
ncbi:hypothetical protein JHW43_008148 [Diplocarpon mali]|nr:hypothetical protein JHW43_008148 [Diplocarpon mali]